MAGRAGELADDAAAVPAATAVRARAELAIVTVNLADLRLGVLMGDKMCLLSGTRGVLGFHPGHTPAASGAAAGQWRADVTRGKASAVTQGSRHARWVLLSPTLPNADQLWRPERGKQGYELNHTNRPA
jgi:hypothetical protein